MGSHDTGSCCWSLSSLTLTLTLTQAEPDQAFTL